MDAGEHRETERREHDAAPRCSADLRAEDREREQRCQNDVHPGHEAGRGDGRALEPRRLQHVASAEQRAGQHAGGEPAATERPYAGRGGHGKRAARDREPQREEREQRIDRDGVLHLHERHTPHRGHEDQRQERPHAAVFAIARTPRFNQRARKAALESYRLSEMEALDTLGRPLRDLRISVTDRCNFRCTYCMPKEVYGRDHRFLDRRELLTFEEIASVARTFVALGTRKIRITGGEPLVRRDLERLVEQLATLDVDLTLTTNASLLAGKARALADAGLQRVTVSLDALDDATFRALNDVDFPVDRVLEGIDAAVAAGLPVKVNAVIKRGVNDDQVAPMAAFFKERGQTLRFIEYMDVGPHERLAARRRRARGRDRRARSTRRLASRRSSLRTAARSRSVGATATAAARSV